MVATPYKETRLIDGIKFNLKVIKTLVTAIENNDSDVDLDKSMVELQSLTALTQDYAKKLAECRKPLAQKSSGNPYDSLELVSERNIRARAWLEKSGWTSNGLVERNLSNEAEQAFVNGEDPVIWGKALKDRLDIP